MYKRLSDYTIVLYKLLVKITESKEQLHTSNSIRCLLLLDDRDFVRINFNSLSADNKAQVFSLSNTKLTLLKVNLESSVL